MWFSLWIDAGTDGNEDVSEHLNNLTQFRDREGRGDKRDFILVSREQSKQEVLAKTCTFWGGTRGRGMNGQGTIVRAAHELAEVRDRD